MLSGLVYGQSRFNVSQWSNELARSGKHSSREMHEGCRLDDVNHNHCFITVICIYWLVGGGG